MATTYSGTATYARFALLETQIRVLLAEAAGAPEETLDMVSKGLADPHYIERVGVQGLFNNKTMGAQLELTIDWRQHAIALKAGGPQVQVPSTWRNAVAPSMKEAIRTFCEAVQFAHLSVECWVAYASHFNRNEVNRKLGFVPAPVRHWAKEPEKANFGFGPLTEASLVIGLAI